jgi:hypothetical protein
MNEEYWPTSDFLNSIVADEVPLGDGPHAAANLRKLIRMTRDPDDSNRDWAVFLLAQLDMDTPEIRKALVDATTDDHEVVRAEALVGLARRDPALAIPLVREALLSESAGIPIFEAAEPCADPTLVEALQPWAEPSEFHLIDQAAEQALKACMK